MYIHACDDVFLCVYKFVYVLYVHSQYVYIYVYIYTHCIVLFYVILDYAMSNHISLII